MLDIEGTTTPVAFVHDVLFPYARARVEAFLQDADIARLHAEYAAEPPQPGLPPWSPVAYVHWLMDRDRKSTGLKALQGKIWEEGYRAGTLRGQVYSDVPPALHRWRSQGRTVAIFSSGSIQAQQNLFAHSTAGDLSPLLSAYFDTTTGPKREPASYTRIARALDRAPRDVLFISDVAGELDAARAAGMHTALCVREQNVAVPPHTHPLIHSFDEIP